MSIYENYLNKEVSYDVDDYFYQGDNTDEAE